MSGRRRPSQLGGQFGGNNRAAPGRQVGRAFQVEEIADGDFAAGRADQRKIGAGAYEIGIQQPSFRRQEFARHRLENLCPPHRPSPRIAARRRLEVPGNSFFRSFSGHPLLVNGAVTGKAPHLQAHPKCSPPLQKSTSVLFFKVYSNKTLLGRACHKLELFNKNYSSITITIIPAAFCKTVFHPLFRLFHMKINL